MTSSLIEVGVELLNRFTSKDGLPNTLSLSKIVEGIPKVYMGHKMISFGSYVMVNIGTTNTIKGRCVLEIAIKRQIIMVGAIL